MQSPADKTSSGERKPSPPVSLTPQQEEAKRRFAEQTDAGMARLREKVKEAERLGVPLHKIVPVS